MRGAKCVDGEVSEAWEASNECETQPRRGGSFHHSNLKSRELGQHNTKNIVPVPRCVNADSSEFIARCQPSAECRAELHDQRTMELKGAKTAEFGAN